MHHYQPVHFRLRELTPPEIYHALPRERILWLLDPRALKAIDSLRSTFGPAYINDWHQGGPNRYRGLRPLDCATGARHSDHKYGRAFDLTFAEINPEEVRQAIRDHPDAETFKQITCVEEEVNWLHISVRNHDKKNQGILWINPTTTRKD